MKLPVQKEPKRKVEVLEPRQILEKRANGDMTVKEGMDMFQSFLKQKFPLNRVAGMLDEQAKAEDVRMNSFGMKFKSPNWMARDKALDKVIDLMDLAKNKGLTGRAAPTKMVFNIISNSPVKVEKVLDAEKPKEESEGA